VKGLILQRWLTIFRLCRVFAGHAIRNSVSLTWRGQTHP
jgi:hypothetical protein